ncbi:lectin-like [Amblyraja radiata]|uniref:lectin-like n=1 Tax=Amblyraja radiata TaxID=386614 RepID=UPI0014039B6A|nr:lectin-like [Amblyraja radiata]
MAIVCPIRLMDSVKFEEGNMMLVWVLVLTALLANDVAETTDSLEREVTQHHLEKRDIVKGSCAEKWFYYPTLCSCYRFFPQKLTWLDAEKFCNQEQNYGHLATVISSDHNTFINNMIGAVSKEKPHAWIGLNDRCQEGNFRWADGSSYIYNNWSSGEPNNYGGVEDCVTVNRYGDGTWNDVKCDISLPFVCSYKLFCD